MGPPLLARAHSPASLLSPQRPLRNLGSSGGCGLQQAMPPDPPPGPWAAPSALPLHAGSGSLLAGGPQGAPLLTGLEPCVSVRPGEGQSLVLGLACAGSPVALADCALGQVRRSGRPGGWAHGSAGLQLGTSHLHGSKRYVTHAHRSDLLALLSRPAPTVDLRPPPSLPRLPARCRHTPTLLQLRCRRFLALPKTSLYWMSPRWGAAAEQVPVRGCMGGRCCIPDGACGSSASCERKKESRRESRTVCGLRGAAGH